MNTLRKGFTLIELLVVIAIIGILASVVLASLNTARTSGSDAAVKSSLNNMRAQAEILFDSEGDYDTICGADTDVTQNATIAQAISAANDANGTAGSVTCGGGTADSEGITAWAIAADLPGGGAYCIDSTGVAREATSGGTDYTADTGGTTNALDSATDTACN